MDPLAAPEVAKILSEFDGRGTAGGPRRRQVYGYYDVYVEVLDDDSPSTSQEPLRAALADYVEVYDPEVASTPFQPTATGFYHRQLASPLDLTALHSTVIVNRMDPAVVPRVAELFGGLDDTDFPQQMGTRRRQLFRYGRDLYFHVQDFDHTDGNQTIDQAWKQADPRFIKICADLDPLVHKYDPARWRSTADQIAKRFYHWEAPA
ncbi:hypothetical protein L3i22_085300 [Actinoplanes sp. L3-i22]|nr:hypothetical protein L3i22_085300 [Actinoplanes sp. L3-i22]